MTEVHPVIWELIELINTQPGWYKRFEEAVARVVKYDLENLQGVHDLQSWLVWANDLIFWVPTENMEGNEVDYRMAAFYFVLNQPSVSPLQKKGPDGLLPSWMVRYANAVGDFLDSTDSITEESLQSFYDSPAYRLYEYLPTPSGWLTFNQFFARQVKPGYRPIDDLCDDHVLVSVADSVFKGSWPIDDSSQITTKGITWSIRELLKDCPYADEFSNGTFMHAYLSPTDYHRLHTPLAGKILWSKVIPGKVYLETHVVKKRLQSNRVWNHVGNRDEVGYQFSQCRGLLILETKFGLVAVLPIGMGLVSSVTMTAEVGVELRKGEEIGYFKFGGSDWIMCLPDSCPVRFTAGIGVHYNQGKQIGIVQV
ncbi:MAG: phosphatidylserine decarboxylase [Nitrososphaerales archaeon]